MTHRLRVGAVNVLGEPERTARTSISFDQGSTWQLVAADDPTVELRPGTVRVSVSRPGLFTVEQELLVTQSAVTRVEPHHPMVVLHRIGSSGVGGLQFHLGVWLVKFRKVDMKKYGWAPMRKELFSHVFHFTGTQALGSGTGWSRLEGHLDPDQEQVDPADGHVEFLEAASTAKSPQLAAVHVPKGFDFTPRHSFLRKRADT